MTWPGVQNLWVISAIGRRTVLGSRGRNPNPGGSLARRRRPLHVASLETESSICVERCEMKGPSAASVSTCCLLSACADEVDDQGARQSEGSHPRSVRALSANLTADLRVPKPP